jgi:hypothetical protein
VFPLIFLRMGNAGPGGRAPHKALSNIRIMAIQPMFETIYEHNDGICLADHGVSAITSDVGRKPTVNPVRTITVPLNAAHTAALLAFQRQYGLSSFTEALRVSSWRWLVQEGLARPEEPREGGPGAE